VASNSDIPVVEAATPWPHVCAPDTDVCDLVRLMTERKIDAVPVADRANNWWALSPLPTFYSY